jgi:CDP-diacylglycerol--glycerol-3-phosphate 3-phosphatidyltransferase
MTLANYLTILRILLIPVFVAAYYSPLEMNTLIAAGVFILACVTDWADGYVARKMDQCSPFGAFLDPVADKILVTVTLVMLAASFATLWFVLPAAIIVAREVLVSALREWMAENQARNTVAVSWIGKVKTTVQMLAIIVLLASGPAGESWMLGTGFILLYAAAALTLWSMIDYLRSAWPVLMTNRE